jgi:hypothetical protein
MRPDAKQYSILFEYQVLISPSRTKLIPKISLTAEVNGKSPHSYQSQIDAF